MSEIARKGSSSRPVLANGAGAPQHLLRRPVRTQIIFRLPKCTADAVAPCNDRPRQSEFGGSGDVVWAFSTLEIGHGILSYAVGCCESLPLCSRLSFMLTVSALLRTGFFLMRTGLFLMLPSSPSLPKPGFSLCSPVAPCTFPYAPPSFPPKSWAPPCQAARTSDDLRSHNRNPKCSSAALAHACFLRGYRFLPRAQATPVAHKTQPASVSSSKHPWPGHDDVRGRSGPDDVHGLVRSQFSASMVQP